MADQEEPRPRYGRTTAQRAASDDVVDLDEMLAGEAGEKVRDTVAAVASRVADATVTQVRSLLEARDIAGRARQAGAGVGALGASGVLGLGAVGALVAASIAGLSRTMPTWAASLCTAALFGAPAAALAYTGQRQIRAPLEQARR